MSRIWRIEINLDETAALLAGLETVEDRGRFLDGFMVGARGFEAISEWPQAKLCGYHVGRKGFEIATIYSDKQSDKGKKSAEAKRLRKVNHGSTTVNGWLDHCSTTDEPSINQASTNRSNDLTNTKESSPSAAASSATPPQDKKRLPGKKKLQLEYPKQVEEMAQRIKDQWPRTHPDGSSLNFDWALMISRLNSILESHSNIPPEVIEEGVMLYLNPPKPPMKWKAPQFYFGPGEKGSTDDPTWIVYARKAFAMNKQRSEANV